MESEKLKQEEAAEQPASRERVLDNPPPELKSPSIGSSASVKDDQSKCQHQNLCRNNGILCCASKCDKYICKDCYDALLCVKWKMDPVYGGPSNTEMVFHSKKCYMKGRTYFQRQSTGTMLWTEDGKNGPSDANNSLKILINWLCAQGNYSKFKNGLGNH